MGYDNYISETHFIEVTKICALSPKCSLLTKFLKSKFGNYRSIRIAFLLCCYSTTISRRPKRSYYRLMVLFYEFILGHFSMVQDRLLPDRRTANPLFPRTLKPSFHNCSNSRIRTTMRTTMRCLYTKGINFHHANLQCYRSWFLLTKP